MSSYTAHYKRRKPSKKKRPRIRKAHYAFGMAIFALTLEYIRALPKAEGLLALEAIYGTFYHAWEQRDVIKFPKQRKR